MKIVSWNMGCGPRQSAYRRSHEEAWEYLLTELAPDIALVQETKAAADAWVGARGTLVMSAEQNDDNGTAVFVRAGLKAAPLNLKSHDCFVAAADVTAADGTALRAISAHVYPRSGKQHQDNLAAFFDVVAASVAGRRFALAGDMNAARHFDDVYKGRKYATLFENIAARGFHDCHFGHVGKEVQSFWGHQAKEAYQLDHVFIDAASAGSVVACGVVDTADTRRLSDHGPMVLTLASEAASAVIEQEPTVT